MSRLQVGNCPADVGPPRPAGSTVATSDGRPYQASGKGGEYALWQPVPPRDGDAVYCRGAHVGTWHGVDEPGEWYVEVFESSKLPADVAEHFRRIGAAP
jgi:hypothetical protein